MRASEILRNLADLIDSADQPMSSAQQAIQSAPQQLMSKEPEVSAIAVDVPDTSEKDSGVFVPPLQAKLEILKKSEGIPNVYDNAGKADELDTIKKHAGLTAAQQVASEDNDITG